MIKFICITQHNLITNWNYQMKFKNYSPAYKLKELHQIKLKSGSIILMNFNIQKYNTILINLS